MKFEGMSAGPVSDMRERLLQFKTNIDVAMSVLDKNGLGDWLADRLVEIGDRVVDKIPLRVDVTRDPFLDDRLRVANLPVEPQELAVKNAVSGDSKTLKVALFRKTGEAAGARRAISEIIKWLNYVTDNRVLTVAGGPLGVGQPRARQHLGPLRSGERTRSARVSRRRFKRRATCRRRSGS